MNYTCLYETTNQKGITMLRIARLHFRLATFPIRRTLSRIQQKNASKRASRQMLGNYERMLTAAIDRVKNDQLAYAN